jgi:hypothetical protein
MTPGRNVLGKLGSQEKCPRRIGLLGEHDSWEKCPGKIGLPGRNVLGRIGLLGEMSWERNVLGEMSWEKCPRRNILGEMSWERNVLGEMSWEKCPRRNILGEMSWENWAPRRNVLGALGILGEMSWGELGSQEKRPGGDFVRRPGRQSGYWGPVLAPEGPSRLR